MCRTDPEARLRAVRAAVESLDAGKQPEAAQTLRAAAEELESWRREVVHRTSTALAVHHDIRNALTGILGNAQLLQMGAAVEQPGVRKRLDSIVREAERIRDLTERLHEARAEMIELEAEPAPTRDREAGTERPETEAA